MILDSDVQQMCLDNGIESRYERMDGEILLEVRWLDDGSSRPAWME